jgi:hypothetical protein
VVNFFTLDSNQIKSNQICLFTQLERYIAYNHLHVRGIRSLLSGACVQGPSHYSQTFTQTEC